MKKVKRFKFEIAAVAVLILVGFLAFSFVAYAAAPVNIRGLSTATKSTTVSAGSTFYETDTGDTYVYKQYPDGTKAWVISSAGSATTYYLASLSAAGSTAITSSATELNRNTGVTAGTAKANGTAVLGPYRNLDRLGLAGLYLGADNGTLVTATAAELNKNAGVTGGTASASKTLVLGTNKNADEFHTAALYLGSAAGTLVTATAAELNKSTGAPASVTTTATPATGTCGVQFVFKDAAGVAITRAFSGIAYISTNVGAHTTAASGIAALTNGSLSELVTGKVIAFTTKSDGTFGITLTNSAGSYYLTFVLPQGIIAVSDVLTVN